MDKKTPVYPPIANAADYIDALIRPQSKDLMVKKKIIIGAGCGTSIAKRSWLPR